MHPHKLLRVFQTKIFIFKLNILNTTNTANATFIAIIHCRDPRPPRSSSDHQGHRDIALSLDLGIPT